MSLSSPRSRPLSVGVPLAHPRHLRRRVSRRGLAAALCALAVVGCQNSSAPPAATAPAPKPDLPRTYAEGIADLKSMAAAIRQAMEGDAHDDAHDPLHEVGFLLRMLPDLATDMSAEAKKVVEDESQRLFDAFGKLDEAFHDAEGDRQAAFDAINADMAASIAALEALLTPAAAPAEAPPAATPENP
jgi:hypothetical protein